MSGDFDIKKYVYEKQFECPTCAYTFIAPIARFGKSRLVSVDTDFKQTFSPFDPIAYDIVVCPFCGYAESAGWFAQALAERKKEHLMSVLYPDYAGREYPLELTTDMVLERFDAFIVCNDVKNADVGTLAYTYLKMAWVCRNSQDAREQKYLALALQTFKEAYRTEDPPIAGMDDNAVSYLIGELERRCGHEDEALKWFGKLIFTKGTEPRIKDRALAQKALIQSARMKAATAAEEAAAATIGTKAVTKKTFPWSK